MFQSLPPTASLPGPGRSSLDTSANTKQASTQGKHHVSGGSDRSTAASSRSTRSTPHSSIREPLLVNMTPQLKGYKTEDFIELAKSFSQGAAELVKARRELRSTEEKWKSLLLVENILISHFHELPLEPNEQQMVFDILQAGYATFDAEFPGVRATHNRPAAVLSMGSVR
ncbi:hypothetical protein BKA70DRAFT_1227685 [Coprinopsis sp. MPI-PUGE-AT-0042]|nr:hypothetical protein BKA70DRAFT_1227685 [Coprinopsis sp. MPI-PUGE-AT-0042]